MTGKIVREEKEEEGYPEVEIELALSTKTDFFR